MVSSRVLSLILMMLYSGPMRPSEIIEEATKESEELSEQSVYHALKKMQESGLVRKNERGPKNVEYEITDKGKELVNEEYFKARDTLISVVRHSVRKEDILVGVLIADLLEKIPAEWKAPEKVDALRNHFKDQLEVMITSTTLLLRSIS